MMIVDLEQAPRTRRALLLLTVVFAVGWTSACKKEPPPPPLPALAPNAPADRIDDTNGKAAVEALLREQAPYIQKARETYPDAKRRYLAGLPAGQSFFGVTQLRDGRGTSEQIFVAVSGIRDGRISGRIASDIVGIKGYKRTDPYSFQESELVDWLISHPDGTEEGNVVGKFLDERNARNGAPDR